MHFLGIIPARYASTRFPGKPLADLGGKPMIQSVYERVRPTVDRLVVATDDERMLCIHSLRNVWEAYSIRPYIKNYRLRSCRLAFCACRWVLRCFC